MDEARSGASAANSRQPCSASRRDGRPCGAPALPGSRFCFTHDPARAGERSEARAKGGRNRAHVVRLRGLVPPRLAGVFDRLEGALVEVHDGRLDPKVASAMAALARAMVSVLTAGELEERVRNIEERLARQAQEVAR